MLSLGRVNTMCCLIAKKDLIPGDPISMKGGIGCNSEANHKSYFILGLQYFLLQSVLMNTAEQKGNVKKKLCWK